MPSEISLPLNTRPEPVSVFVVDDEQVIATTLAMILKNSGFNAVAFSNPLKALELASTLAPNLLITDVAMPELNGIELAIRFRSIHPDCKILLFSGNAAARGLLESAKLEDQANFHFLEKPVHPGDLLAAIGKLSNANLPEDHEERRSSQYCSSNLETGDSESGRRA